jgi:hypothetical protein
MGLWDLDPDLNRIPTALVDSYRSVVAPDAVSIGSLRTDAPEKT